MIDSIRRIGERIDSEWKSSGSKVSALPAVAARVLHDEQPHRHYDLSKLAQWTLSQRTYPQACNPFGPLGPPAFTVWANGNLFANVYAYTTPEVVIHDHDFAGAFINLSGTTLHVTYEFDDAERVDPTLHVGDLAVRDVEVVRTGDVRRIDAGRRFIHQVWHVDQPTVVLVIRTGPLPRPARRQFQYLHAGFATEVFRDASMLLDAPERFRYTQKMAQCLSSSSRDTVAYLKTLLRIERPWDAAWHFLDHWRDLRAIGALDDMLRIGARHQGRWFAGLAKAGDEVDLFTSIQWSGVRSIDDRIALALLMTFDGWAPMREWVEHLLPDSDPEERFVDTLRRLGDAGAIPLQLGDGGAAMLTCILKSDGNRDAWRRSVRETFSIEQRSDWTLANSIDRTLREHRLLKPLFA